MDKHTHGIGHGILSVFAQGAALPWQTSERWDGRRRWLDKEHQPTFMAPAPDAWVSIPVRPGLPGPLSITGMWVLDVFPVYYNAARPVAARLGSGGGASLSVFPFANSNIEPEMHGCHPIAPCMISQHAWFICAQLGATGAARNGHQCKVA